jgi:carbon starvation protein CstA
LGALIGYLVERQRDNLRNHCLIGLLIGGVFGAIVVHPQLQVPYSYLRETLLHNMSEFIFPFGCSVILKVVKTTE